MAQTLGLGIQDQRLQAYEDCAKRGCLDSDEEGHEGWEIADIILELAGARVSRLFIFPSQGTIRSDNGREFLNTLLGMSDLLEPQNGH